MIVVNVAGVWAVMAAYPVTTTIVAVATGLSLPTCLIALSIAAAVFVWVRL